MPKKKPFQKPGDRFQYEFPDPVTEGMWHIVSHRELTAEEIKRVLRFIVCLGVERPRMSEISAFKWPEML
jgi:hypothetical protein